jgi:parallel beta-helix repeat protein
MGTKSKSFALVIVVLFLTSIVVLPPALVKGESKTIIVPDDYSTIKDAVFYANDGDTVYVKKGTYQESNLIVDKAISIIGEDRQSTIIIGQANSFMVLVNHSQVTISGLTLIASSTQKPVVSASHYHKEIVGIQIEQSHNCNINGNKIINSGTAIWVHSSNNNIIEANTLLDNYYGIDITMSSTHNIVRENDISSSQVGIRFSDRNVINTVVCANNITSAYTGLFFYFTGLNFVVGNYIAYNTHATHFVDSCNNVLHHNNFVHNLRDISEDSSHYDDITIRKSINFWDDKKEGNYWSAYIGTGDGGIGKSPYLLNEFNQDNYPLLQAVDITNFVSYSSTTLPYPSSTQPPTISPKPSPSSTYSSTPTPSLSPTSTITPTPVSSNYWLSPIFLIVIVSLIAIVTVASGLLIYFKKYHKRKSN